MPGTALQTEPEIPVRVQMTSRQTERMMPVRVQMTRLRTEQEMQSTVRQSKFVNFVHSLDCVA